MVLLRDRPGAGTRIRYQVGDSEDIILDLLSATDFADG